MADMNTPIVDNSSRIRPATGLGGKGSPVQGGGLMSQIPEAVSSAVTPLIQQAGQQINSGVNSALGTDGGNPYSAMTRVPQPSSIWGPINPPSRREDLFLPNGMQPIATPMSAFANGGKVAAQKAQAQGRGNDTMLVHMTPKEVGGLQALAMANGGSLTVNPQTGLPEAGFLDSLLPTILGVGATILSGGTITPLMAGLGVGGFEALRTGDLGKGLMAGLGAFGGANLGSALSTAGASNLGAEATKQALTQSGTQQVAADQVAQQMLAENAAIMGTGAGTTGVAGSLGGMTPEGLLGGSLGYTSGVAAATPSATLGNVMSGISGIGNEAGRANLMNAFKGQFGQMGTGEKIATGLGAMNTFGAFEQPAMQPLVTPEDDYEYKGPYTPTRRAVTYPGADRRSTSEFSYFSPSNPIPYAQGGDVNMEDGGFVVDARTVSEIGNGSSNAGLERLARLGARPIQGRGDGVSDSIPANIGGSQDARVARDEAYLPPEAVKRAGGATKLYAMMDKAHKARKSAKRGQDTGGLKALMA